jgi:hypothetical protein
VVKCDIIEKREVVKIMTEDSIREKVKAILDGYCSLIGIPNRGIKIPMKDYIRLRQQAIDELKEHEGGFEMFFEPEESAAAYMPEPSMQRKEPHPEPKTDKIQPIPVRESREQQSVGRRKETEVRTSYEPLFEDDSYEEEPFDELAIFNGLTE